MAGLAQLAKASGHQVSGCDNNVYPPMSELLHTEQIEIFSGYQAQHLHTAKINTHDNTHDQVVIGNVLARGNPLIEAVLDGRYRYQSGPQWLHDNLLHKRKVIAVAGTHGKTTTSSMITWIMHCCGQNPGYLIGGQPGNFSQSAQLGQGEWFVIEADEYDTAFFDKRAKFVHYRPDTVILNNLEFDHADIFDNINQIKTQFHHLMRTIPSRGSVIANDDDEHVADVLNLGCWSKVIPFSIRNPNCRWFASPLTADFSRFEIGHNPSPHNSQPYSGSVAWSCIGQHNMQNALAAIATAHSIGIEIEHACKALATFKATVRRLQLLFDQENICLYEDFAHHPTAIALTIDAIKSKYRQHKIIALVELRSNTMKSGWHGDALGKSFNKADLTFIYKPETLNWKPQTLDTRTDLRVCENKADLIAQTESMMVKNSVIICMSNGSFDNIPKALQERLETRFMTPHKAPAWSLGES